MLFHVEAELEVQKTAGGLACDVRRFCVVGWSNGRKHPSKPLLVVLAQWRKTTTTSDIDSRSHRVHEV